MEHIYAVKSSEELSAYQAFSSHIQPTLDRYIHWLKSNFAVSSLPRSIVWTSVEIATKAISDIPVPAYTNDFRVVITPDLSAWHKIYLAQVSGLTEEDTKDIRHYYSHALNDRHILQILGHELAHHSTYFIDEVYDSGRGIWFEEGMAEYISRRFFLTEEEYEQERIINQQLVALFEQKHGIRPLDDFSASTYQADFFTIFYAYWRSFLAVDKIISTHGGDVKEVFRSYQQWFSSQSPLTLAQWFFLEF